MFGRLASGWAGPMKEPGPRLVRMGGAMFDLVCDSTHPSLRKRAHGWITTGCCSGASSSQATVTRIMSRRAARALGVEDCVKASREPRRRRTSTSSASRQMASTSHRPRQVLHHGIGRAHRRTTTHRTAATATAVLRIQIALFPAHMSSGA